MSKPIPYDSAELVGLERERDPGSRVHAVKSHIEELIRSGHREEAMEIHQWLGRELARRGKIEVTDG